MNAHKTLLLRLLYAKADVGPLLELGLEYSQISALLGELIAEEQVTLQDGAPAVTKAGLAALRTDSATHRARSDGGFIAPLESARIDRLDADALYLPPRRLSFF